MTRPHTTFHRLVAALQLVLIAPAALFMSMVVIRAVQPIEHEPSHSAERIVAWFGGRPWTLDILLSALPLLVMALGAITLWRQWRDDEPLRQDAMRSVAAIRAHFLLLLIAATTVVAAGILAIVAVHALTD
jgi:hypothetical protein